MCITESFSNKTKDRSAFPVIIAVCLIFFMFSGK
jgi:hypothetical protein